MVVVAGLLVIVGVLAWAYRDGGERPLSPLVAPAVLPEPGR